MALASQGAAPSSMGAMTPGTNLAIDPSEFRPENKAKEDFRQHLDESNERFEMVKKTYELMHTQQTVDYVRRMHEHWGKFDHAQLNIMDALVLLNQLIDESDPDIDLPNIMHAYQTAERIREKHPDKDWLQLTGLIHDLGKVMGVWGQPQFSVVGDTFPVGCAFSDTIVFADSFAHNPDLHNPQYNTPCGMYKEHCGLDNVNMSWGHDEYMYQVLKANGSTLPEEALYIIRFHSFYPYHTSGAYQHLIDAKDARLFPWIREFNQFDLYSKSDAVPNIDELRPYYQSLIDKYCPGVYRW